MFASNKTFGSFNRPQKSFGFVSVNCVLNVLLMGYQFQISQLIVRAIKVFMVNLQFAFDWAIKCFPHHAMYAASKIFSIFAQINNRVAFNQPIFNGSMCRFTSPSFAQLDGMGCGYASAQKSSNLFQGRTLFKHFFASGIFAASSVLPLAIRRTFPKSLISYKFSKPRTGFHVSIVLLHLR